ncbi:MAG: bacteriohemerythrin [Rhodospirillales bacterium]
MTIFSWKEEYSIGRSQIDSQHKRLFEIGGRLHQAMAAGKGQEAIAPILDDLIAYTRSHFGMEEALMQTHRYPAFATHRAEHEALTERVLEFRRQFAEGKIALTVDMLQFLKDWLVRHIGEVDRRFGAWLNERVTAPAKF